MVVFYLVTSTYIGDYSDDVIKILFIFSPLFAPFENFLLYSTKTPRCNKLAQTHREYASVDAYILCTYFSNHGNSHYTHVLHKCKQV